MLFRAVAARKTRNLRQEVNSFPVVSSQSNWFITSVKMCFFLWEAEVGAWGGDWYNEESTITCGEHDSLALSCN